MYETCYGRVLTSKLKNIFVKKKKSAYSICQYPCTVTFPEALHMFFYCFCTMQCRVNDAKC